MLSKRQFMNYNKKMRKTLIGHETNIFKWIRKRIYNLLIKMGLSIFNRYLIEKYREKRKKKRKKCKFTESLDRYFAE